MAIVTEETTGRCSQCGRHAKEPRRMRIDPVDYVPPPLQNEELVSGEAKSGPAPGRDPFTSVLMECPAPSF